MSSDEAHVKRLDRVRSQDTLRVSTSTADSSPEKAEDYQLMLETEIHRNLIHKDCHASHFNPLKNTKVTKDYRTKMVDWMIEVCTSFKCSERTYFLAVDLFDNYLRLSKRTIENSEVHVVGVTSMFMASKYEDIFPLHSTVIADKISHGAFN